MSKLFILLSFLLPTLPAQADPLAAKNFEASPFAGVCEGQVLVRNKSYLADRAYWDPLVNQCGTEIQILPETGFFATMAGRLGEESERAKSVAFLEKLGKRTLETIDYNAKLADLWVHCARGAESEKAWFEGKLAAARDLAKTNASLGAFDESFYDAGKCSGRMAELKALVAKRGHDLRIARESMRATAALHNQVMGALRKGADAAVVAANWSLPLGLDRIELPAEKVPLSAEEKAASAKIVSDAQKSARDEMSRIGEAEAARVLAWQRKHPGGAPEAVEPPAAPWVLEYYKVGGGRGLSPLPAGAQMQLDMAVSRKVHEDVFPRAFGDYAKALGEVPVLGFLDKREPTDSDLAAAAAQVLANAGRTRADISKTLAKGEKGTTDQSRINKLRDLLQNGGVLSELLKEDPSSCGVAAGLANYSSNRGTRNGALLAAGLFVSGIGAAAFGPAVLATAGLSVTGAALSTAVGTAATGGSLYADYEQYRRAKAGAFSVVHTDRDTFGAGSSVVESGKYWEARNAFVINAAISLATTAGPAAYKELFGKNQETLQSELVLKRLMSKEGGGMSEAQAKATVRALAGSDKEAARRAVESISRALGVDEKEVLVFQKAVEKQLLDPSTRTELFTYAQRLHELKGPKGSEERRVLLERMHQILDQVDGVKMARNKRADAMRVVIAASELGPYDNVEVALRASGVAKNVAEKVNGWNEGLYGLARTYEQARLNMTLPEIQALAPGKRLEAAYKKALEQFGVSDPALRATMLGCGIGSAK